MLHSDRLQTAAVATTPFDDQKPGTSGLRKKTSVFMQPHYLENFVQSCFEALREQSPAGFQDKTLVVGGDGRYHNDTAIQTILRMAVANGFGRLMLAQNGILSTPAASAVIRQQRAFAGFILSASHNPGGRDKDFGIKLNMSNGGPAPQQITDRIHQHTKTLTAYRTTGIASLDISELREQRLGTTIVEVFNPLRDYTNVLEGLFDFDAIRSLFAQGFRMKFDAMHGVTGPYAQHLLEEWLGAPPDTVIRAVPLPDFGGMHPDPNLKHSRELVQLMRGADAPDFGAAADADGDRNLILGRGAFVSPGDSLAIIAAYAPSIITPYRAGLSGVARSMPTSCAVDRVAAQLQIPCYETPTGWKFFGNLMDAGKAAICGEESFGTGSDHIREKDALWAVLAWLSILAQTRQSVSELQSRHWQRFGRNYYQRHDYEGLPAEGAKQMLAELRAMLPQLGGQSIGKCTVQTADDFAYTDPVDGSVTNRQGLRILMNDGSRIVLRLSGTGTAGAILRVYLETWRDDAGRSDINQALLPLSHAARALLQLRERFGVEGPSVVT